MSGFEYSSVNSVQNICREKENRWIASTCKALVYGVWCIRVTGMQYFEPITTYNCRQFQLIHIRTESFRTSNILCSFFFSIKREYRPFQVKMCLAMLVWGARATIFYNFCEIQSRMKENNWRKKKNHNDGATIINKLMRTRRLIFCLLSSSIFDSIMFLE